MTSHRDAISQASTRALATEAAGILAAPSQRVLATGQLLLGGATYRLRDVDPLGGADGSRLVHALARGAAVTIRGAQTHGELFASVAAAIQHATGSAADLDVHVTGPDAPEAAPHADDHDVAVVQLAGTRRWLLGEERVVLEPGHLLLVPGGRSHTAVSTGARVSIHVAIHCARSLRRRPELVELLRVGITRAGRTASGCRDR